VLIPAQYYVISGKLYFRNLHFIVGNRKICTTLQTQIKIKKKWQILKFKKRHQLQDIIEAVYLFEISTTENQQQKLMI
jgi:hypothetical protein